MNNLPGMANATSSFALMFSNARALLTMYSRELMTCLPLLVEESAVFTGSKEG
jgi:hypothetical protein